MSSQELGSLGPSAIQAIDLAIANLVEIAKQPNSSASNVVNSGARFRRA